MDETPISNGSEIINSSRKEEGIISRPTPKYFVNSFDEFQLKLLDFEIRTKTKYILIDCAKRFSDQSVILKENLKLHWEEDIPYFHFGTKTYQCHLGKDVNKSKKRKYNETLNNILDTSRKTYRSLKPSKKLGCPAVIYVTRIVKIPEHRIKGDVSIAYEKARASKLIKRKISACIPVGEECYMFNLPELADHKNHPTGDDAALTEPVDPRVKEQIVKIVQCGERNISVISKLLFMFVENELKETDRQRRRFFPEQKFIRSVKVRTLQKMKQSNPESQVQKLESSESNQSFSQQNSEPENLEVNCEPFKDLNLNEYNKQQLINSCNSSIRTIQTVMQYLDEERLDQLSQSLNDFLNSISSKVTLEKCRRPSNKFPSTNGNSDLGKVLVHIKREPSEIVASQAKVLATSEYNSITDKVITEHSNILKQPKKTQLILIKRSQDESNLQTALPISSSPPKLCYITKIM